MKKYSKKTIQDVDLKDSRIFLRLDLNIPFKNNIPTDTTKIEEVLPTIKYIVDREPSRLVVATHVGRPSGPEYQSTEPIQTLLNEKTGLYFKFQSLYDKLTEKYIILENLRIYKEEEEGYGNYFLDNFDFVVVDSFATLHRKSRSFVDTNVPTVSGLLVENELKKLCEMGEIDLFIFGGSKAADKLMVIESLADCVAVVLGVLSISIYKKKGFKIGKSKFEDNFILSKEVVLPDDFLVFDGDEYKTKSCDQIGDDDCIVDIGEKTIEKIDELITKAERIFWNGPPGIFENEDSSLGTIALVECLEERIKNGGKVFVGGGDTLAAVDMFSDAKKFTGVFTAGGAIMTLLANKEMPGLDSILNKE